MSRLVDLDHACRQAFDHEHQLEPGWTSGDLEFDDEPPSTELASEPGQRKWMLFGVGISGLATAGVVLWLTSTPTPETAANRLELPPTAFAVADAELPVVEQLPVVTDDAPAPVEEQHASTLAASLGAALDSPDAGGFRAPPPPPPLIERPAAAAPSRASRRRRGKVVEAPVVEPAALAPVVVEPTPSVVVEPSLGALPSFEDEVLPPEPVLDPPASEDHVDASAAVAPSETGELLDVTADELPAL